MLAAWHSSSICLKTMHASKPPNKVQEHANRGIMDVRIFTLQVAPAYILLDNNPIANHMVTSLSPEAGSSAQA
jgi:hypothetical protein